MCRDAEVAVWPIGAAMRPPLAHPSSCRGSNNLRPGATIARSVERGQHRDGSSRRPPANRGAVKRQSGTRHRQRKAPLPGILDEKLVGKGRTR